jgi:hypothetical protein
MSALPDESTHWKLVYRDTFDREEPPSVDEQGVGIIDGLVALWRKTLHEGVGPDGDATFSQFSLRWASGYASIPIPHSGCSPALRALRLRAFPPLPPGTPPTDDAWKDGCRTAPHGHDDTFLAALARLHLQLVTDTSHDAFHEAARKVLDASVLTIA